MKLTPQQQDKANELIQRFCWEMHHLVDEIAPGNGVVAMRLTYGTMVELELVDRNNVATGPNGDKHTIHKNVTLPVVATGMWKSAP